MNMVLTLRAPELQMLLAFAGCNKSGKKTELRRRSLELLKLPSIPVQMKIKELYRSIQQGNANGAQSPNGEPRSPQPPASSVSNDLQPTMNLHPTAKPPGSQQQRRQRKQRTATMYPNHDLQAAAMMPVRRPMYQHSPLYPYPSNQAGMIPPHPPMNVQFPSHEIKMKGLAFYEVIDKIMKPSPLLAFPSESSHENIFVFRITCQQLAMVRGSQPGIKADDANEIQLQVRFCVLESVAEQEDCFPLGVTLKVNGKIVSLPNPIPSSKPGLEPRRPPMPVNVTAYAKLSPKAENHLTAAWNPEIGRTHYVAVYLVRKLTAYDLLLKLKLHSVRKAMHTCSLIRDELKEVTDSDIATTSLRVSLVCPLSKRRMSTPCKSVSCNHLQCFDALTYLKINEKKPSWTCPVCDKRASYNNLFIDSYFQEVIDSSDAVEVKILQDGSWSSVGMEKDEEKTPEKNPECESQVTPDNDDVVATDASTSFAKESSATSTVETHDSVKNTESSNPKKKAAVVELRAELDEE